MAVPRTSIVELTPLQQMTQTTPTRLWNDSASIEELTYSIEQGAVGATANPVIAVTILKKEIGTWRPRIQRLLDEMPTATEDEIGWKLVQALSVRAARLLEPAFAINHGRDGRLSIQTDPRYYRNSDAIVKQAEIFSKLAPNMIVKIPATRAGIPAIEEATYRVDAVEQEGYDGIDLGPLGYLGTKEELAEHLRRRGLSLAGGFMPMPFTDPAGMPVAMDELAALLDLFDTVKSGDHAPTPKPTLADAGSAARQAAPGQAQSNHSLGLQPEAWDRLAEHVQQASELCRQRGYQPTFHHHAGTYVEAPWEIEELLERTDVGLCLDTGHLVLGGGDPQQAVREWGARINHVHLKDVRHSVIDQVIREGASMMEVWRRGAFCRLGAGDLDIDAILTELLAREYAGWLVVEQDMIPGPDSPRDAAKVDQDRNRSYLRARGL